MLSYEVFEDGEPTGLVIVNSASKQDAENVWTHFYPNIPVTLKPLSDSYPPMFQNCIISKASVSKPK